MAGGKLAGGAAIIHVGGTTESGGSKRRVRVPTDAMHDEASPPKRGSSRGGGVSLMRVPRSSTSCSSTGDEKTLWRS